MKSILKLILEIIFLIIGTPVFWLVAVLGFCYTFFKHLIKLDYSISKQLTPILRSVNLINDCFANAAGGEMLNDIFKVKNEIVRFGKWYETISAVTGLLKIYEKDIWLRRFLDKAFYLFEKNHCINAITKMQAFYYKHINKIK